MKSNTPQHLKDLVAKLQRKEPGIVLDIETGAVYQSNEYEPDEYLGTLPRKLIPDRKRLEREHKEELEDSLDNFHCQSHRDPEVRVISVGELVRNGCPTNAVGPFLYQLRQQGYRVIERP